MTTRADRVEGGDKDKLAALAVKMHRARVEAERLRKERHALACEREGAKQSRACWVATWVPPQIGDFGRVENAGYWDHAGGNSEDDDGNHVLLWCRNCQRREKLRKPYAEARALLGSLRSQISRLAKKLAQSTDTDPAAPTGD